MDSSRSRLGSARALNTSALFCASAGPSVGAAGGQQAVSVAGSSRGSEVIYPLSLDIDIHQCMSAACRRLRLDCSAAVRDDDVVRGAGSGREQQEQQAQADGGAE